jgi:hypothetical protein
MSFINHSQTIPKNKSKPSSTYIQSWSFLWTLDSSNLELLVKKIDLTLELVCFSFWKYSLDSELKGL